MEKRLDAEKTLTVLANIWADQYGQKITSVNIVRRAGNEEVTNSSDNSDIYR